MRCFGLFIFVFLFVAFCYGQNNCDLQGPFACSGGDILGMDFGDDEDDDFFEYFQSNGDASSNGFCSIVQQGEYEISGSDIFVEFEIDDDECIITGDEDNCECVDSFSLSISDNCSVVTGPNGETCTIANVCDDQFSCPGGVTPVDNPDREPSANGCGPSAFPLAGPSFAFEECCNEHDFCYGTCGASKLQCDNDFYSCMFCACQEEYDNFVSELACEELACSYYQAVEEFGCFAFTSGQENACTCPGKSEEQTIEKGTPTSKFGPVHPTMRQTELFCDSPFDPNCGDDSDSFFSIPSFSFSNGFSSIFSSYSSIFSSFSSFPTSQFSSNNSLFSALYSSDASVVFVSTGVLFSAILLLL